MKYLLFSFLLTWSTFAKAQKIDSIYVNLYTDSLKKGTYNYINIDGKLDNGRYLPLDSTQIIFTASDGRFVGNTLWIDPNFTKAKVSIKVVLRSRPEMFKEFTIYIKKIPNPENGSFNLAGAIEFDKNLYFPYRNPSGNIQLCQFDGTSLILIPNLKIRHYDDGSQFRDLEVFNNKLAGKIGTEDPPGIQAFNLFPFGIPPQYSSL